MLLNRDSQYIEVMNLNPLTQVYEPDKKRLEQVRLERAEQTQSGWNEWKRMLREEFNILLILS